MHKSFFDFARVHHAAGLGNDTRIELEALSPARLQPDPDRACHFQSDTMLQVRRPNKDRPVEGLGAGVGSGGPMAGGAFPAHPLDCNPTNADLRA